jgi:hypothetical protein
MVKVIAWLKKVPVLGWAVLGLILVGFVVWRLLVRAWNAEQRLQVAAQLANNRRKLEAVEHQAGLKALDDQAQARAEYERRKAALEAKKAKIEAATPSKLAAEINNAFRGG